MTNEQIFLIQWKRLREDIVAEVADQMKQSGSVRFSKLQESYRVKLTRWNNEMYAEGRWMDLLPDAQKQALLAALPQQKLTEVPVSKFNAAIMPVAAVAGGAALFAICSATHTGLPITLLGTVAGAAIPTIAVNSAKNTKGGQEIERVKRAYGLQLDNTGRKLADLLK